MGGIYIMHMETRSGHAVLVWKAER